MAFALSDLSFNPLKSALEARCLCRLLLQLQASSASISQKEGPDRKQNAAQIYS